MGRAQFDQAGFLAAARALIAERGPQAVTVDSVAERLKAPKGSFYYRFASRDALLGEVWLEAVLAYQEGFVTAIEAGDGLRAALHTPAWARRHLDDARLLMLYSRHDFVQGDWPVPLRRGVAAQAQRFAACLRTFARGAFGGAGRAEVRRAAFVLAEVPIAAVKPHLQRRERPPKLVDELVMTTYRAIVGTGAAAEDRRCSRQGSAIGLAKRPWSDRAGPEGNGAANRGNRRKRGKEMAPGRGKGQSEEVNGQSAEKRIRQ